MESAPSTAENVSIAHGVHMALDVARTVAEYVPGRQFTQLEIESVPDEPE